jgi:hypothetical protein
MEPSHPGEEHSSALAEHARRVERLLGLLLAFAAGFTVVFSAGLMVAVGGGRAHLGGRLAVAVAGLLLLGVIDTQATRLAKRRRPLLTPDPPGYRRFVVWSTLGLLVAAVLLFGLAWYLPEMGGRE